MAVITRELVAAAVTGKTSVAAGKAAIETAGWTTHVYRNTITATGDEAKVVYADYRPSMGGGNVGLIDSAWLIYSGEDSTKYEVSAHP